MSVVFLRARRETMARLRLTSHGPEETRRLGERIGEVVEGGAVLLLEGPFGAGKTVFVQGLAAGLGVGGHVGSPSFIMINEHQGRLRLFHVDLYRQEGGLDEETLDALGDYFGRDGVCAVEWPGQLPATLRTGSTEVRFEPADGETRRISIITREDRIAEAARRAGAQE